MRQVHGSPNHSQTQGKIERYYVSLNNFTAAEVYFGTGELIQKNVNY